MNSIGVVFATLLIPVSNNAALLGAEAADRFLEGTGESLILAIGWVVHVTMWGDERKRMCGGSRAGQCAFDRSVRSTCPGME